MTAWLPASASTAAGKADAVFLAVLGLAALFLVFITGLMVLFVLRYGRLRHPRAAQIEGHPWLELVWTLVPLALFLAIFYYGWTSYDYSRHPPRDAMLVRVTAQQWKWRFTYPSGKQAQVLHVPVNRPMKLEVVSADVIHGFYVPAFRLKVDAVPGRVNRTWFQATRPGVYAIQCTVICGVEHSSMLGQVAVVPEADFKAWYFAPEGVAQAPAAPAVPAGLALMRSKGCLDCHSVDGSPGVGPTLKGVFGRREELEEAGGRVRRVTVDERRLRRAILEPGREVVRGYPPVLPQVPLEPGEVDQVVGYLKELP